jgi:hypothetical protein
VVEVSAEARAAQARLLLDDALLTEVLDGIEAAAIEAWASTGDDDEAKREFAFHSLKASRRVRDTLRGVVDNGLVAANRATRR